MIIFTLCSGAYFLCCSRVWNNGIVHFEVMGIIWNENFNGPDNTLCKCTKGQILLLANS